MAELYDQPVSPLDSDFLQTEMKYVAPLHRVRLALKILERTCDPDPSFPFGIISSVYFDTFDWLFLGEKRNSDYLKTKIRLRWYDSGGQGAHDQSFMEAKYRVGSKRSKVRVMSNIPASELGSISLNSSRLFQAPDALSAAGIRIPQGLLPALIVRYHRRRFLNRRTGGRICIDYNISCPRVNPQMLGKMLPCDLGVAVLESKGSDDELPFRLRDFLKIGFRRASFSKYFECYQKVTATTF